MPGFGKSGTWRIMRFRESMWIARNYIGAAGTGRVPGIDT